MEVRRINIAAMARSGKLWGLGLACALVCGAASPARASVTQESIVQDDNELIYATPDHVARELDRVAALGIDRIRVTIIWATIAPNAASSRRPRFDATDPAADPSANWARYDTVVLLARQHGIGVDLNVTSPIPYWADRGRVPASGFKKTYSPSAGEFGRFVEAVGRRYGGTYRIGTLVPSATTPPQNLLGIPLPVPGHKRPPPPGTPVYAPRVDSWSIWNEPNEGGWLTPQWRKRGSGKWTEAAPAIYRRLVDSAWRALANTGHGPDRILIGETAAKGALGHGVGYSMRPMPFLRALYCVSHSYRPLVGARARELDCPGRAGDFAAAHPALFAATGYAHHPYSFHAPPWEGMPDPNVVTLADLPRLERALDRIFAAYGRPRPATSGGPPGLPVYLTEYGYKSNPPNPFVEFNQLQQAAYINQGEYMAWSDPRVRCFAQFLLVDSAPKADAARGSRSFWSTFQTGLIGFDGDPKPAYTAYRIPIFLPDPRPGPRVMIWGQLRPGQRAGRQTAAIEYRSAGASAFGVLRQLQTANPRGFVVAHAALTKPGMVRLAWRDSATGVVYRSRAVRVG
jgi:hypothetical protein